MASLRIIQICGKSAYLITSSTLFCLTDISSGVLLEILIALELDVIRKRSSTRKSFKDCSHIFATRIKHHTLWTLANPDSFSWLSSAFVNRTRPIDFLAAEFLDVIKLLFFADDTLLPGLSTSDSPRFGSGRCGWLIEAILKLLFLNTTVHSI